MINPQSHSAHYFCYLHEYSARKVQETPTVSTYSKICQIR